MPDQLGDTLDGLFSVVHVETLEDGTIDCLSVLVHDSRDGMLKSFYEARVRRNSIDGSSPETVSLYTAMKGLEQTCRGTSLVAFEVAAVRRFIDEACLACGVANPFSSGNDIDVKVLAQNKLKPLDGGAAGLRTAARRLGIHRLPNSNSPSWGAVVAWYILRRLVKICPI